MRTLLAVAAAAQATIAFTSAPVGISSATRIHKAQSRSATFSSFSSPMSTLPDLNYGLSDEDFRSWLMGEVSDCPGRDTYSSVYEDSVDAIVKWRRRYRGNPRLWKRVLKKERVVKELAEGAPIIHAVKKCVASSRGSEKIAIIDLCSGKGYLSMFLSEMLPEEKVERFVLVDKAWAIANNETELKPHHMN
ncbi:hypothetical protein ACHAWF_008178 [Thalassiosira exigua]